jgi:hypothetical protein
VTAEEVTEMVLCGSPRDVTATLAGMDADSLRALVMVLRERMAPSCTNCGRQRKRRKIGGWEGARGLCMACWCRARKAGFPAKVPDAPKRRLTPALAAKAAEHQAARDARMEDFADLRSWDVPVAEAAERVGIRNRSTVRVYERAYQAAKGNPQREAA